MSCKCKIIDGKCQITSKSKVKKSKPRKYKNARKYTICEAEPHGNSKYRYSLTRIWDNSKEKILFIMLNPSTADFKMDDPTIKKIVNYGDSWGYGGIYVGNLYAFKSPIPKDMYDEPLDVRKGPENEKYLKDLISKTDKVVYAWGNGEKEPDWLKPLVKKPYIIELSKYGIPKHPLYLKKELTLKLYKRN